MFPQAWKRIFAATAVFLVAAALSVGAWAEPLWHEVPDDGPVQVRTLPDFIDLAAKLGPAVVNISTQQNETPASQSPGAEDPFEQFGPPFGQFGPHNQSLGSGFIINKDGYILTNEHVVEDASKILVTTKDGQEYAAKVVGTDAKTDVALLKIEAKRDLPVAPLGDSNKLKVGEWVMAIGNPFGFDHSVTAGIVSAKGRFIPGSYDEFIQTDASINPGNSGGPLIDLRGAVVGVNSAIYTRTGSNTGIGFAIPINIVRDELRQLKEAGKVVRGWLGVYIQRVTPELATSLGLPEPKGALVAEVIKDSPAMKAGIRRGDVIIGYDGQPITHSQQLPLLVGRTSIGSTATVKLIRGKKTEEIPVKITASREAELELAMHHGTKPEAAKIPFGLAVKDLNPGLARELKLGDRSGVVVYSVMPGSAADDAGLHARDIILEVNRHPVKDVDSYQRALKEAHGGKIVLLLVKRDKNTFFIPLKREG
jgi:serine protease Do